MVDGAFYAQKCYYWVRDQEKIKSNELAVSTVVIDVLGIYDTKFGVIKLERLTSFGSRVVNEVVPFKNKYNKEVSMSIFATQADSMFFAHQMPQPDPGPLSFDRIESIRQLGSVTPEDLLGSTSHPRPRIIIFVDEEADGYDPDITLAEDPDITGADDTNITGADDTDITGANDTDITSADADDTNLILVDDLTKIALDMFSRLPSTSVIYIPPTTFEENYQILQNCLNMYGRDVIRMDTSDNYFCAFSHQCWNTQEYCLFARIATLEYMKVNVDSYVKDFSKRNAKGLMRKNLDELAKANEHGYYTYPDELVIRGSCDLFGVKLERLTSFGSRVVNEVVPFKNKYNKEVSMSIFATQADSMFFAHQMPQPDPGPLSFDRIESIR